MAEAQVNSTSAAYDTMVSKWHLSRTLLRGTEGMREAGKIYLPQFSEELNEEYKTRVQRSFLFNAYRFAINNLVGKIYSKPTVLNEDMSAALVEWSNDVDLLGNDITQFSKIHTKEVLATGLSHILVDFPRVEPGQTLAQQRRSGARPYMRIVKAEELIAARAQIINGKETIVHARILEPSMEQDGEFGEKEVARIRVLDPGLVRIYEFVDDEWVLVDVADMIGADGRPMDVPLKTTYSDKKAFMVSTLLLQDLGDLNVRHWQSNSDQINILTFHRFPMVFGTGITDDEANNAVIAPNQFLTASNPQAKFGVVESTGAAIDAGFKDLAQLEEKMMRMAMDPLIVRPGNQTATGRALDSKEANSQLQALALSVQDTLDNSYNCMGLWSGQVAGTVEVNTDFGITMDKVSDVDALLKMFMANVISHETLYVELKRRGVLSEDFAGKEEFDKIIDGMSRLGDLALENGPGDNPDEAGGLDEPSGGLVRV
jgi:hypothetical protein